MDSARPSNSKSLVSLQDAAQLLGVSVPVLLTWNENNILKPTITSTGSVGYTNEQIQQFLIIRQSLHLRESNPQSTSHLTPPLTSSVATVGPILHRKTHSTSKQLPFFIACVGGLVITVLVLQAVAQPGSDTTRVTRSNQAGSQTSRLRLTDRTPTTMPLPLADDSTHAKTLRAEGEDVLSKKTITQDIFAAKTQEKSASTKYAQDGVIATLLGQLGKDRTGTAPDGMNENSGLSVLSSQRTCTDCAESEDNASAFDENGNIRDESKTDATTSLLEKLGSGITSGSAKQAGSLPAVQILLPLLGMIALMVLLRRQFAVALGFPHQNIHPPIIPSHQTVEKILEVSQKTDGTVIIIFQGKEIKISKPELYSESDQFIERLMELTQLNQKELEYDYVKDGKIKFSTPLSRLVTRLGFVGIKRDLFFPRTSKQMVLFRRYITTVDLADMNLTPTQVLKELTAAF